MTTPSHPIHPTGAFNGGSTLPGISNREYFAATALQGLVANPHVMQRVGSATTISDTQKIELISDMAVAYADYLVASLNRSAK